ncbi:MAG: phosphoribosylformylglycinamidine synthase subunit PurQ [Chloroflexi bacterium]|nr:phosphoribosylformylglycinamidine synthase subunit PurQ [Chloroflexota bacterium]
MKIGVIVFPGSNGDHDAQHALQATLGATVDLIWHTETAVAGYDALVLPGGFAHGDYLRTGAIARFSPVMAAVDDFVRAGRPVLGICNGFQVLCEAGLLPGALVRNDSLRFVCRRVDVVVERSDTPWTAAIAPGRVLRLPIAHGEGCYFADPATVAALEAENRIILRYCDPSGAVTAAANPNGSLHNIAGICNAARNVVGMMPHPERDADVLLGNGDGRLVLASLVAAVVAAA